jgi:hypothetical protein
LIYRWIRCTGTQRQRIRRSESVEVRERGPLPKVQLRGIGKGDPTGG